ncbi:RCC1 domain-containing protein [Amycolatopsis sp. NPDC051071]|uniref:RCC1 domain-containing protein n=1 Tax=Amycolatopsis sp. NPDC051071 TaxID=3154637 RepID=UPI00344AA664
METVVAFLIGWAVNRAQRAGQRLDGRVDQAVDAAVDKIWAIIAAKIGPAPAITRLQAEAAQRAAVSDEARVESVRVLQSAADQDSHFENALRTAALEAMNLSTRTQTTPPPAAHIIRGNYVGSVVAGGSVKINQRIANYARRNPSLFALITAGLIIVLLLAGYGVVKIVSALGSESSTATPASSASETSRGHSILATGPNAACGVMSDASITCWGEGGEYLRPSGTFTDIAVKENVGCGISVDKTVTCWDTSPAHTNTGPSPVPRPTRHVESPSGQFKAITTDCGIRNTGAIACWANRALTPPNGQFVAIAAGQYGALCAIHADKAVSCWGRTDNEVVKAGSPAGLFTSVSVGGYHACGVREDRTAVCWGKNDEGQSTAPTGKFIEITTGEEHSCGLREDQTVACWGRAKGGQTAPPSGAFTTLGAGAGGEYSCGVRPDGKVDCWGRDGKIQSPAGSLIPN